MKKTATLINGCNSRKNCDTYEWAMQFKKQTTVTHNGRCNSWGKKPPGTYKWTMEFMEKNRATYKWMQLTSTYK